MVGLHALRQSLKISYPRGGGGWLRVCHLVRISSKSYALLLDDVTCIYYHKIWYVYKVNCYLLPITKIIIPNFTTFTQLKPFLKSALYQGHAMHRGRTISPCIGRLIMPCEDNAYKHKTDILLMLVFRVFTFLLRYVIL